MSDSNIRYDIKYIIRICTIAALGGLLLGYDSSIISGAIEPLSRHYSLSPAQIGWAVSNVIIGCIIGCYAGGPLGDKLGRKKTLVITALVFLVSVLGTSFATSFTMFVCFRIIGGLAIGLACVISPIYMAEVSPAAFRGRAITMHSFCLVGGQVIVLLTNFLIARGMTDAWMVELGWRYILGAALVPSVLFLLVVWFVPESPRWNVMAGHDEAALKTLARISNLEHAKSVFQEIKNSLQQHSAPIDKKFTLNKKTMMFLTIGLGLAVGNQLTGINVIQYFGPTLLLNITGNLDDAMFKTFWLAVFQFSGVVTGQYLIDRIGRTKLLLWGSLWSFIFLIYTFIAFYYQFKGYASVIGLFGFMFTFGTTWAQVIWTVIGEIFPTHIRAIGMGISISGMWIASFIISQGFPLINKSQFLLEHFHGGFPILVFAICSLFTWWFAKRFVPETKNVHLEEIEQLVVAKFAKKAIANTSDVHSL
ncbi:sugar porter family MFS transporter [Martelella alba]|uniref:Sugar porter family MFS transporter n=1 Tax=Martelella alba TaxID=2590451 RepID=A0ABY2SE81_9HYPH|nr:sugar porter family MFS transporter [Martelella alba]TKI03009.1 sugar porter family MFS transporter [Martelella alba]